MKKIKLTKNELKTQKDHLKRYHRYLPTLYIKKKLLQAEMLKIEHALHVAQARLDSLYQEISTWSGLLLSDERWKKLLSIQKVICQSGNIAGVDIPIMDHIEFQEEPYDLANTPLWFDSVLPYMQRQYEEMVSIAVFREQRKRLRQELRITSQRVNLFEKVKIPEAEETIRKITVYLGDLQTVSFSWGRIAKKKLNRQNRA